MLKGAQVVPVGIECRLRDGSYNMTVNPKPEDRMTEEEKKAGRVSRDKYRIKKADRLLVISYGPGDLRGTLLNILS